MSAIKQMRQMLDGLMGTCRNENGDLKKEKLHFSNNRICKSFLLSCCPHEIFAQSRFDLGKCPKVHDIALKADFEKSRKYEHEFQVEAHQQLKNFIAESKRRSQVAKVRLAITQDVLSIEEAKKLDYLHQIDEKINEVIKKAENLGAEGAVEESLKLMQTVDLLREEKLQTIADFKSRTPASLGQQKKLRVCEVCSSYLGLNDDDKRLADHFNGKLHLGFLYIKEKYEELESLIQERCIKEVLDNEFKPAHSTKRNLSPSPNTKQKHLRCSNVNFARRTTCNRCGKEKTAIPQRKKLGHEIGKAAAEKSRGLFSADDWQCGRCGNVNWARRQQCNMCNAPKFGEVEERTGLGGGYNERENVEYIEREESDGEYDEFGRKKKKYRGSDDKPNKVKQTIKEEKVKESYKYKEEEEEEEEDDDDEDGDLSKYDLTGWGDDEEENEVSKKDKDKKSSPSRSQSSASSRSDSSHSRSRSSSSSSSSSKSSHSSSDSTKPKSKNKRHYSRSRSGSPVSKKRSKRDSSASSRSSSASSRSRSRDRSASYSPANRKT